MGPFMKETTAKQVVRVNQPTLAAQSSIVSTVLGDEEMSSEVKFKSEDMKPTMA